MHSTLTVKNLEKTPQIEDYFDQHADKLSLHLERFNQDLIEIHGMIERNVHRDEFFVIITVKLLSVKLRSQESSRDVLKALNSGFESLIRQAEKLKARILRKNNRRK